MPGAFLNANSKKEWILRFQGIEKVEDLAKLLTLLEKDIDSNKHNSIKYKPIDESLLHLLEKTKDNRYRLSKIEKKSGGHREINAPDDDLKRIQSLINCLLQSRFRNLSLHWNYIDYTQRLRNRK